MTNRLTLRSSSPGQRIVSCVLLALVAGAMLALLAANTPANAAVLTAGGAKYGVLAQSSAPPSTPETPLAYGNGPVVHSTAPYTIFWDPETKMGGAEGLIEGFLEGAGQESGTLENVFDVASQYGDATGKVAFDSTFRGGFTDVDPFPATLNCSEPSPCLTDAQVRTELAKYITANGLPTGLNPASGPTPIYFVFTPPGTTVCLNRPSEDCSNTGSGERLCSFHSFTTVNGATVLYAVEPWTVRTGCQDGSGTLEEPNKNPADVIVNGVAAQYVATATDPLLTGWHDSGSEPQAEAPDKCRNEFEGGLFEAHPPESYNQILAGVLYYVNDEFDQAALYDGYPGVPCLNEVSNEPRFTSPNPVRSGDQVTFNATQSRVDLGVAKYRWTFGDGTSAQVDCEGRVPTSRFTPAQCNGTSGTGSPNPVASVVHQYTYGGTYEVTLTVTDDGGNTATTSRVLTVTGPAPPSPESKGSESNGSTSSQSTTSSGGGNSTSPAPGGGSPAAKPPAPTVVATQAVASHSLSSVLKSGLVIRYSVSEQVAGRFEVLLASSIARKLAIHGAPATGLAKGTAAQTVIAKAILVTTKGGHSTYRLMLSKATAARLRKLPKVSLTIRLVVHNASSPAVTTVLNTVTLSR